MLDLQPMRRAFRTLNRRAGRVRGYAIFAVVFLVALVIAAFSRTIIVEYVALTTAWYRQGVLKYVVWVIATIYILVMIRAEPQRPERSRARGGSGLRFGQGPLPSWDRFNPWLDRRAGTVAGYLIVIGYWFVETVAMIVDMLARLLWLLAMTLLVIMVAHSLAGPITEMYFREIHWAGVMFVFLAASSYLVIWRFKRSSRRYPDICASLLYYRILMFGDHLLDRLIPKKPAGQPALKPTEKPPDEQPARQLFDPS